MRRLFPFGSSFFFSFFLSFLLTFLFSQQVHGTPLAGKREGGCSPFYTRARRALLPLTNSRRTPVRFFLFFSFPSLTAPSPIHMLLLAPSSRVAPSPRVTLIASPPHRHASPFVASPSPRRSVVLRHRHASPSSRVAFVASPHRHASPSSCVALAASLHRHASPSFPRPRPHRVV
jgi:hypothetical protein